MRSLDDGPLDPASYGWKAHYLAHLRQAGFTVPVGVAVPAHEPLDAAALWAAVHALVPEGGPLAVRSSATDEDSTSSSGAGRYLTVINTFDVEGLAAAVKTVAGGDGSKPIGVVVQAAVTPILAGVGFSTDPALLARGVLVISWVTGHGINLVDGSDPGSTLVVRPGDSAPGSEWPGSAESLDELMRALRRLEHDLGGPVDVEWCLAPDGSLTLLQVRPIVVPASGAVHLTTTSDFADLPPVVRQHPKVRLRQRAAELGIPMSAATVSIANHTSHGGPSIPVGATRHAPGTSVVLLHPQRVGTRVVREFASNATSSDVDFFTRSCRRYAVRRYPSERDIPATVRSVHAAGAETSWLTAVLVQDIYSPVATGILRRADATYLVECGMGHFIPKGYVPTASFVLDEDLTVVSSDLPYQDRVYHFIDGHVVTETPPEEQLALSDADVREAVSQLRPMLESQPGLALEFGVLRQKDGRIEAYVIDAAESDADVHFSEAVGARGAISLGTAMGVPVDLRRTAVLEEDLNRHLLDTGDVGTPQDGRIFLARRASVDLLPLVNSCGSNTAFLFEDASLLSHLAVVLRERGVTAGVVGTAAADEIAAMGRAEVVVSAQGVSVNRPTPTGA